MVNIALKAPTAPASTLENIILLASPSPRTATHAFVDVAPGSAAMGNAQENALSPASPISKALTTSISPSVGFVSTYLPRTAWKIPFL